MQTKYGFPVVNGVLLGFDEVDWYRSLGWANSQMHRAQQVTLKYVLDNCQWSCHCCRGSWAYGHSADAVDLGVHSGMSPKPSLDASATS